MFYLILRAESESMMLIKASLHCELFQVQVSAAWITTDHMMDSSPESEARSDSTCVSAATQQDPSCLTSIITYLIVMCVSKEPRKKHMLTDLQQVYVQY